MKKVILFVIFQIILTNNAIANCNLNLVIASGKYIEELDKSKIYKYVNNSVCEVLDYEIGKCSKTQSAELKKAFNVHAVHRNYCQPHLPPPESAPDKKLFMKGADLFSWNDFQGFQWYALLPGTNRTKTTKELTDVKNSEWHLIQKLQQLPPQTEVNWNNLVTIQDKKNLNFSYPPSGVVKAIEQNAVKANLKLKILTD